MRFATSLIVCGNLICLTWLVPAATLASEVKLDASVAKLDTEQNIRWFDARDIGIEGKAWDDTESYFNRLPARAKGVVRDPVWSLSQHTAGLCIRFVSE